MYLISRFSFKDNYFKVYSALLYSTAHPHLSNYNTIFVPYPRTFHYPHLPLSFISSSYLRSRGANSEAHIPHHVPHYTSRYTSPHDVHFITPHDIPGRSRPALQRLSLSWRHHLTTVLLPSFRILY